MDMLSLMTDEELVCRAQAGCMASFGELVGRYQVPIRHFLRRKCGTREDTDDLTQETFLRAYKKLWSFHRGAEFRPWIFTVAYRVALNALRRRRLANLGETVTSGPVAPPPRCELEVAEERGRLWDIVQAQVTPIQFTVLWLFYVEQLSTRHIAQVTGKSEGAVKTLLCRARKALLPHLRPFVTEPAPNGVTAEADGGPVPPAEGARR